MHSYMMSSTVLSLSSGLLFSYISESLGQSYEDEGPEFVHVISSSAFGTTHTQVSFALDSVASNWSNSDTGFR